MSTHYTILGNHNFGLGLLIENLWSVHGPDLGIDVIKMIDDSENDIHSFEFKHPEIPTQILHYNEWSKNDNTTYLNSGMSGNSQKKIFTFFKDRFDVDMHQYGHCFHSSSVIASSVKSGHGISLSPHVTIAPFSQLGNFIFVNRNSSIGHHVVIENYVVISAGVTITSRTIIGEGTYIGAGATILDGIKVGKNTMIGAGAVVTKNIPDNVVAYGVPAKVIRKNS